MKSQQGNTTVIVGIVVALVVLGLIAATVMNKPKTDMAATNGGTTMEQKTGEGMMEPTGAMGGEEGVMVGGAAMLPSRDIVDNAMLASNVTTVVAAVKAAGLVETLKGPGPFTVFAPTNAAFEKLPAGTVDTLLLPENKEKLSSILTYHVVAGRYTSADLKDGQELTTVNGQTIKITMKDGKWMVNDAMVETPDVISSNGVTFVIDTVLMPQ